MVRVVKGTGFIHWRDGKFSLGYLGEFPRYVTQGETLQALRDHRTGLYRDLKGAPIPGVQRARQSELT
ncbi:MAG: type II toxin-antitoxin system HicB family antitoxin [Verrucomicrobiota bacterium]